MAFRLLQAARFASRTSAVRASALAVTAGSASLLKKPAYAPASCQGEKPWDQLRAALPDSEGLVPFGQSISLGSLMGFCSGFALKKVGRVAAGLFGALFVLEQALAYQGYITVNWEKAEKDLITVLDLNKDGKFDVKDLNDGYLQCLKVLQNNTAGLSGGFAGGFLLGARYG
mmetsp:Transcript_64587/g.151353  ORF Transcript_64587/g.151353 Transcript_64587/m.151353 type:complete len:172 (-) Transcript_64587:116-631(-)